MQPIINLKPGVVFQRTTVSASQIFLSPLRPFNKQMAQMLRSYHRFPKLTSENRCRNRQLRNINIIIRVSLYGDLSDCYLGVKIVIKIH